MAIKILASHHSHEVDQMTIINSTDFKIKLTHLLNANIRDGGAGLIFPGHNYNISKQKQ